MSKLKLTFSCTNLDRARPLIDSTVEPEGIDLNMVMVAVPERHDRMTRNLDFDACEYSLATYLPAKERGLPITAIPVFPHRQFRHESIFIREKPDLKGPKDLEGRRIGVPHYTNSTGVWVRGILSHEYGVDFKGCTWVTERDDEVPDWEPPSGVKVERQPANERLPSGFERGDFDVLIYPPVPQAVAQKQPGFRRLFPEYQKEEIAYFRKTKIFPIMHCIVIKDEILERYPWVSLSLAKAWAQARKIMHEHLPRQSSSLLWYRDYWSEQRAIFGDLWAYGLAANRHVIEQEIEYEVEQGILKKRPKVEELFAKNTLDWQEQERWIGVSGRI
ncbi:MAG: ABC transporter substrate-binding protein [Candidatus Binatia bacterium]